MAPKKVDEFKRLLNIFPTNVMFDMTADEYEKRHGFKPKPSLYAPFYQDGDKIYCNNECMSKDFILFILAKIVDKCILTEPPKKKK